MQLPCDGYLVTRGVRVEDFDDHCGLCKVDAGDLRCSLPRWILAQTPTVLRPNIVCEDRTPGLPWGGRARPSGQQDTFDGHGVYEDPALAAPASATKSSSMATRMPGS